MSHPCPCCAGHGCEECDSTGRRYHEGFDVDGLTIMVSGSGDGLTPELRNAFAAIGKAAMAKINADALQGEQPDAD